MGHFCQLITLLPAEDRFSLEFSTLLLLKPHQFIAHASIQARKSSCQDPARNGKGGHRHSQVVYHFTYRLLIIFFLLNFKSSRLQGTCLTCAPTVHDILLRYSPVTLVKGFLISLHITYPPTLPARLPQHTPIQTPWHIYYSACTSIVMQSSCIMPQTHKLSYYSFSRPLARVQQAGWEEWTNTSPVLYLCSPGNKEEGG